MKVRDVSCGADFHDLCPQQVCDFVANLSRTLSQSRVMEFGLNRMLGSADPEHIDFSDRLAA